VLTEQNLTAVTPRFSVGARGAGVGRGAPAARGSEHQDGGDPAAGPLRGAAGPHHGAVAHLRPRVDLHRRHAPERGPSLAIPDVGNRGWGTRPAPRQARRDRPPHRRPAPGPLQRRQAGGDEAGGRPRGALPLPREAIPAAVRRAVWERDGGRCQWPLDGGGCCGSTHRLELDHRLPWARWGTPTVEGLRLLCRSHNSLAAKRAFGAACVERHAGLHRSRGSPGRRGRSGTGAWLATPVNGDRRPACERTPYGRPRRAMSRSCQRPSVSWASSAPHRAMNMSHCVSHGSPCVPRKASAPWPSSTAAHHSMSS
jgi:hypothetical protein